MSPNVDLNIKLYCISTKNSKKQKIRSYSVLKGSVNLKLTEGNKFLFFKVMVKCQRT